jgi:hypothetical protein
LLPKKGFRGQVTLTPGIPTIKTGYDVIERKPVFVESRMALVKHELRENIFRLSGENYQDAHKKTIKMYQGEQGTFVLEKFIFD